jgi:queuine tRNA-ribosyltransferase
MHPVVFAATAIDGTARTGSATTARGAYRTPCFMPVGTRGAIKYLSAIDYERLGIEIVLGNTYHLMLRPGADVVARFGGLGPFAGWRGLTLTDSGGFQVFSLSPMVDDDGVTFKSTYDGSKHRFTPEAAVATQELLGADIQMVLDVCPPLPSPADVVRLAVERTADWAVRARAAHRRLDQAMFGIVQGGIDIALRAESARRTAELDFDGYGVGGLSVGESRDEMLPALAAALEHLPPDRPRYLMGVGDPAALVEAVGLGVDQFDCVMQTRLGRHGTALTSAGKVQMKAVRNADSDEPIDVTCPCEVCERHSRGYLRHLFQVGEPTAARLLSVHNLAWTLDLMARMRAAIEQGTFARLRSDVLSVWG